MNEQQSKELSFDQMKDALELATTKNQMEESLVQIKDGQDQLLAGITSTDNKDLFKEKLDNYDMSTLTELTKSNKFVDGIFTEEDGSPMDIATSFESKEREYQFKRDLILYFKSSQEYEEKIDKAIESINESYSEFKDDMDRICNTMSDNLLAFIEELKDKASGLTGEEKRKAAGHILHIESAYTMELFKMNLEKYPSTRENTKREFASYARKKNMMDRYKKMCKTANIQPIFSDILEKERMSFEARFLPPSNESYTKDDFFLFILIRYFAMNGIKGLNLKLHSALAVCLRNIYGNKMVDEVKEKFLTSIIELINLY